MVRFKIPREFLCMQADLLCEDGSLSWVDSCNDALVWRLKPDFDADDDLRTALLLSGNDVLWRFDPAQLRALMSVSRDITNIPWSMIASRPKFVSALKQLIADVTSKWESTNFSYYKNVYAKQNKLFSSLVGAAISRRKLDSYMRSDATRSHFLSQFVPPDGSSTLAPPTYHRLKFEGHGTLTGRLTTRSGPDFLTLNKAYRDIIVSRWEGGQIWYIDYSSLEPRTFRAISASQNITKNFYKDIAEQFLGDRGRADEAKSMFLQRFYGASLETLVSLGYTNEDRVRALSAFVDNEFGTREATQRLVKEYTQNGCVRNAFGRMIHIEAGAKPHVIFNNWVQSSAVDVANMGFTKIVESVQKADVQIVPICVIHDALIVDVHPRAERYVDVLRNVGSRIEVIDAKFAIHCERIS